jgi:hypothetical protein
MPKGNLKSGLPCVSLPEGILIPSWSMINDACCLAARIDPGESRDMRTAAGHGA